MPDVQHSALTGANLHEPKGAGSAAIDTVYVSDGAGSGTWQKIEDGSVNSDGAADGTVLMADGSNGSAFEALPTTVHGQMAVSGNSTVTAITTLGTYVTISEGTPASSELNGVTFTTDHLTVPSAGVYLLQANVSFEGTTNDTYKFDFGINGITPAGGAIRRKTSSADVGALSLNMIKTLAASDDIYLLVQNETDADDPTLTDWQLNVVKLGEV